MRKVLVGILIFLLLLIGGFVVINFFSSVFTIPSSFNTSREKDAVNREKAMDTSEASMNASTTVALSWYDIVCTETDTIPDITDIQSTIKRSNAILMRSNGTFRVKLGNRTSIIDADLCFLTSGEDDKLKTILRAFQSSAPLTSFVLSTTIKNTASQMRTKGFSVPSSNIAIVDKTEILIPSVTLLHELGHSWSLPHPFNLEGKGFGDLPPACSDSSSRVLQVESCPERLRTCKGAKEDELLDNVMDYLPETCGKKYRFTQFQVDTITSYVEKLPLGTFAL